MGSSSWISRTRYSGLFTVARDGETTWPPPPVTRLRRTGGRSGRCAGEGSRRKTADVGPAPARAGARRRGLAVRCVAISPAALQVHLTVFALAIVIGYYVIGHVHHALHTPLMSVDQRDLGIIVVGALFRSPTPISRSS